MRKQKLIMPLDTIMTRLDGWIGGPDHVPAHVAELIAEAMPHARNGTIAAIRARMLLRHKKALSRE
ncbi:hypothetical protein [Bradyrhizobium sp. UFLA05-112]